MKPQTLSPTHKPVMTYGLLYLTLLLGFLSYQTPTHADPVIRQYDIQAGSLATAINQLAETGNIQAIYDTQTTQGRESKGLKGSYSTEAALQKLLAGTGLVYGLSDGTVTIRAGARPDSKPLLPVANPSPNSPEPMSESTLPKVTVEADSAYDPEYYADPYNKDYVIPNATAGTKTDTAIMETPLNVQVISKQVLKEQQVISLDKALRNVSGVTTSGTTGLGAGSEPNTAQTFFLRGFASNTLFRNGFRMDGNAFGNGAQFANIESVEVLKGPAAILYGRVEPGGMVNIVTKQPRATPYYSLNQQFGSYDLYRTSIDATGPLTKDDTLLYRVNTSFQSNNSFRDQVKGEDVFFAPILKWNISPRTQATLEMEYNRQLSSADSQVLPFDKNFNIVDLPHNRNFGERNPIETENIFVGLNWSHQFDDDWSIKHQVAFKRQDVNQGNSAFPFAANFNNSYFNNPIPDANVTPFINFTNNKVARFINRGNFTNDTIATNLDLTGHFKTWGLEHTLLFGGDYYRFDTSSNTSTGGLNGFFEQGDPPWASPSIIDINNPNHPGTNLNALDARSISTQNVDNYGLYMQDQIKLPYNVHVMGGLRYQYVHSTGTGANTELGQSLDTPIKRDPQTDDAVTPRVGLLWQPQKWLSLYGNYVENFGANTGAFAFVKGTNGKPLPPQSAQQWEVGAKGEFFNGRLRTTLAYYDLTKQNIASGDPEPTHRNCGGTSGCSILLGEVRSRGPELDIQGEILPGWNVIATYTNQDVRITKGGADASNGNFFNVKGNRLQYVPRNIGSFWSTYAVQQGDLKGFQIGGGVTLQDGVVDATNRQKSTGYALVGLMAGYSFEVDKAKINLQLNVDNLLDKSYFTNAFSVRDRGNAQLTPVTFSPPRTFMGSINVQY